MKPSYGVSTTRRAKRDAYPRKALAGCVQESLCKRLRGVVTPRILSLLEAAARGALPFGFGGQVVVAAGFGAEPFAVADGFVPGDAGNRLLGMIEVGIGPAGRGWVLRRVEEANIFGVGDLRGGEVKAIDPDAVDGAFAVLAGVGAHEEEAGGDAE